MESPIAVGFKGDEKRGFEDMFPSFCVFSSFALSSFLWTRTDGKSTKLSRPKILMIMRRKREGSKTK